MHLFLCYSLGVSRWSSAARCAVFSAVIVLVVCACLDADPAVSHYEDGMPRCLRCWALPGSVLSYPRAPHIRWVFGVMYRIEVVWKKKQGSDMARSQVQRNTVVSMIHAGLPKGSGTSYFGSECRNQGSPVPFTRQVLGRRGRQCF